MTLPRIALLVSLAANLALGGWLLFRPAAPAEVSLARLTPSVPPRTPVGAPASSLDSPVTRDTWPSLQSGSDADYAAHLRTEGFPPDLIRALLRERIRARFKDRLDDLKSGAKDEYWRNSEFWRPDANLSPAARATRRAIEREINEAVKLAMGPGFETSDPIEQAHNLRDYGQLPREKIDQLIAINRDYDELSAQIRDAANGLRLKADRDQLRLLESEKRADLAATLTPEELLEYDLRSSSSATTVRSRLSYFNPTEAEFRALAKVQLEFDREYGRTNLDRAEEERRREAEATLTARMQSVLTPERAAEYQLVADRSFQATARFLQEFNYDANLARQIVPLQRSVAERAEAIRRQPLYTPEIRAAELAGLYREVEAKLGGLLSPAALAAYQDDAGRWLQKLKPKPDVPAKP